MDLEDFAEPEVAAVVAAAGLILSPRMRELVRRGAVLGLSELLRASRTLASVPSGGRAASDNGLEDIFARHDDAGPG